MGIRDEALMLAYHVYQLSSGEPNRDQEVSDAAAAAGLDKGQTARARDWLEERGLARVPDAMGSVIELTSAGVEFVEDRIADLESRPDKIGF